MPQDNNDLDVLRKAYKEAPGSIDAATRLAEHYTNLGWLNEALKIYNILIEQHPDEYPVLLACGNICYRKENFKEALSIFKKLSILKPDRVEGWNNLGIVQIAMKDFNAAKNAFQKVLEIEPDNHGALLNMGNYHDHVGATNTAIEYFKKATAVRPYYTEAWFNLGNAYLKKKQYEKAIEIFEKSLQYNPKFSSAFKNIGFAFEQLENYDKAVAFYHKALQINRTDHSLYVNIATVYTRQKKYDPAKDFFLKAVKLAPNDAAGWLGLRSLSLLMGDIKTYIKSTLSILHRLDVKEVADSLQTLRKLKQYEFIDTLLNALNKLDTENAEIDAERMLAYGRSKEARQKAKLFYKKLSFSADPSDHVLSACAAYCLMTGDYDGAISHSLRIRQKDSAAVMLLCTALIENSETAKAEQYIRNFLPGNQDCFEAWYLLAKIYALGNDKEKAKESLTRALETGFADIDQLEKEPLLKEMYREMAGSE